MLCRRVDDPNRVSYRVLKCGSVTQTGSTEYMFVVDINTAEEGREGYVRRPRLLECTAQHKVSMRYLCNLSQGSAKQGDGWKNYKTLPPCQRSGMSLRVNGVWADDNISQMQEIARLHSCKERCKLGSSSATLH